MLTVNQVAAQLAVCHKTIRRLIRSGQLAAVKVGGAIRVDPQAVAAYLAANRIKGPSPVVPTPKKGPAAGGRYLEYLRS